MKTPNYIYTLILGLLLMSFFSFAQQELTIKVVENSDNQLKLEAVGGTAPYKWVVSGDEFFSKEFKGNQVTVPNVGKGSVVIIIHDSNKKMKYLVLNR